MRKKNNDKTDMNKKNKAGYVSFIAAIETHQVHLDMFVSDWDFGNYPLLTSGKASNVVSTHSD